VIDQCHAKVTSDRGLFDAAVSLLYLVLGPRLWPHARTVRPTVSLHELIESIVVAAAWRSTLRQL